MDHIAQRFQILLSPLLLAGISVAVATNSTAQLPPAPAFDPPAAQTSYTACQPPNAGEYLLLVVSQTLESQEQVRQTLPPHTSAIVCNYLNDVVTRVSGFTTAETANAWAKYMKESVGLSAVVARPPELAVTAPIASRKPASPSVAATTGVRSPAPASQGQAYNPQVLGAGYAVLVDYFSRPALALQVQQLVGKEIGLVSYRQRPYLLAVQTTDQNLANSTLQALTDRGLWAMVVDSRRVTLLRQSINVQQAAIR